MIAGGVCAFGRNESDEFGAEARMVQPRIGNISIGNAVTGHLEKATPLLHVAVMLPYTVISSDQTLC